MLQPRIYLLGLLPFRPIIRLGCRPTPAECGLDRPAARARQVAGVRRTRLHGSAVLGSVRLSLERGDLEPGPVGAPGTSTACLWLSLVPADSHGPAKMRGPARPQFRSEDRFGSKSENRHASKCFPLFTQQRTSPRYFGMPVSCPQADIGT